MPRGETKHLKPHQFKKGAPSANPLGARLHNPVTKALKKLTLETYREVIELALNGNIEDLKAIVADPNTPAIQVGVATAILRAIKDGDPSVLERFAARIVGKIPDHIQVDVNSVSEVNFNARIAVVTDEELKARLAKIRSDV